MAKPCNGQRSRTRYTAVNPSVATCRCLFFSDATDARPSIRRCSTPQRRLTLVCSPAGIVEPSFILGMNATRIMTGASSILKRESRRTVAGLTSTNAPQLRFRRRQSRREHWQIALMRAAERGAIMMRAQIAMLKGIHHGAEPEDPERRKHARKDRVVKQDRLGARCPLYPSQRRENGHRRTSELGRLC